MTIILGLGGSLRDGSATSVALKIALTGAESVGARIQHVDLATLNLPMFRGTYTFEGYTRQERDTLEAYFETVEGADGLILASPTYHNTISGAVKNALDLLEIEREDLPSRLAGKVVGLVTVQGGSSGTGVNTLTTMLLATRAMGAWVSPTMVSVPSSRRAFDDGRATNESIEARLRGLGAEVAQASVVWSQRAAIQQE